ncbi:MAG: zf-HC2 domain-containing protein [Acidimicrobiales bacterium]
MRCSTCQEALSARLDGETTGVSLDDLDHHVASCAACRRFSLDITDVHRLVRVRAAEPVPDLTRSILDAASEAVPAATATSNGGAARGWIRYALVVIGLTMMALALPSLVLHDTGNAIHLTRELSAWDAAFGAGLLFAAWQPTRARGLLPMAAVLAGAQVLGSVIDVASGRSPILSESHHALELVGVLLLWLLCRTATPTRPTTTFRFLRTA